MKWQTLINKLAYTSNAVNLIQKAIEEVGSFDLTEIPLHVYPYYIKKIKSGGTEQFVSPVTFVDNTLITRHYKYEQQLNVSYKTSFEITQSQTIIFCDYTEKTTEEPT